MDVVAKMKCVSITSSDYGNGMVQKKVRFEAIYDQGIPEDVRFYKATPTGHMEMLIDNPAAIEALVPGQSYYFNISKA